MSTLAKKSIVAIREGGISLFLKKTSVFFIVKMRPLRNLLYPYAIYSFSHLNTDKYSIDDLVRFAFFGAGGFIRPAQVKSEITKLIESVKSLDPKTIIEIGTFNGGTLFLFSRVANKNAEIISLDLPYGQFGGGYPKWKIPLYQKFSRPGQILTFFRENSHDEKVFQQIKNHLNGKCVDFLFIDGDHTYEGVKRDFNMYSKLVRPGGIIALHDIAVHPVESGCTVNLFWDELKHNKKYEELIDDKNQGWGGIGILYI